MQEHHITVAGERHDLPRPFHVLATQNPIEQEGTYPLPEAQLDRFMLEVDVPYPDLEAERRMLFSTTSGDEPEAPSVLSTEELMLAQRLIRLIPVGESVADAILKLVRSARPDEAADDFITQHVSWGPGPRATQALMLGARARALLDGRLSPSVDDVIALAKPVLQHRMAITFAARADGVTLDSLVDRLTASIG
ncbi:MAG: MoxR family ATPase, partial [Hyphomicrobiales bacterium]|nr:MoxR family ATPase [Hyphomicrobiales bacterium]